MNLVILLLMLSVSSLATAVDVKLYDGSYTIKGKTQKVEGQGTVEVFEYIPYASAKRLDYAKQCGVDVECREPYYGNHTKCMQYNKNGGVSGTEDCLVLVVRTPDVSPKKKRPVIVWIHGGGLYQGSGDKASKLWDFTLDVNSVVVTINYRLGLLGFLSYKPLKDSRLKTYGNYGHYDQITALKWVNNNIDKFGGDPSRVTLMGGSAGASSVLAMLASPLANNLFHNIIPISNAQQWTVTNQDVSRKKETTSVVKTLKCDGKDDEAKCIREKSPEDIQLCLKDMPWRGAGYFLFPRQYNFITDSPYFTTVDGVIIERAPIDYRSLSFKPEHKIRVVLSGSAQECQRSKAKSYTTLKTEITANLSNFQTVTGKDHFNGKSMDAVTDEVLKAYEVVESGKVAGYYANKYRTIVSDVRNACPVNHLAATLSQSPYLEVRRIYSYYIDDVHSFKHGELEDIGFEPKTNLTSKADKNIQKAFREMVKSVAHDTIHQKWKPYPSSTMYITENGGEIRNTRPENRGCLFWEQYKMGHEYGWEN